MATKEDVQYIKMTQTPVPKLIIQLGIPTTISMLITNLYSMADTYFVSQISVTASAATGVVFALMAIFQAFGFCFGHGAGSNISRQLGARQVDKAKVFASTSFFLAILVGSIIMVCGLIFLEPLVYMLGSTDTILNDAKIYATFILCAGPAMCTSCVLNNILRYEGKATFAMIGLTTGGIVNMILDPILIFGLDMGIAGAGLATAFSQYLSVIILMQPYLRGVTVTKLSIKYFTKTFADVKNIILTGCPSLSRQGLNSIAMTTLNNQAGIYGDVAIAAMSVVGRCGNLLFSAALGIAQGFQPVSAYNYGAKKYSRVKEAAFFTMKIGATILGTLCLVCFIKAPFIVSLFRKEAEVIQIGSQALRYLCLTLYLLPLASVCNMLFQSIGKSFTALILALIQSGLLYIPMLMILPMFLGLTGVQIAQPLAYLFATCINVPCMLRFFKTLPDDDKDVL